MTEQANVEVSQEMEQFISYVEKLSVLELSKLVKAPSRRHRNGHARRQRHHLR